VVATVLKQAVQAIPATPPRYGLLVVATPATIVPAAGATVNDGMGIEWAPEQAYGGGVVALDCGSTTTIDEDPYPANVESDPFVVWAEDHCSTFGWRDHDYEARATRQLEATQSAQIAHELWHGTLAQAEGLANAWLREDPFIVTGAAVAPNVALALLESGLAEMLGGRRGMIHCSPLMLTYLRTEYAIEQVGTTWVTAMGTALVADAGYDGSAPDGNGSTNEWLYATPWVQYRLGAAEVLGADQPGGWQRYFDRSLNKVKVQAQRTALLQWDYTVPAGSKHGVLAAQTNVAAFGGFS
jgi:hypothetical protein